MYKGFWLSKGYIHTIDGCYRIKGKAFIDENSFEEWGYVYHKHYYVSSYAQKYSLLPLGKISLNGGKTFIHTQENHYFSYRCGSDTYRGRYNQELKSWRMTWHIEGPKKNTIINKIYYRKF